ncbi:sigma 54-interacting transcriptional regulator [Crassaminicella profunda]|uniref:sigma 54-interacting transcriptional regulator n=1 Tax=Crassaminicella profunda TaxID=1286698 RepID=UPI001CA70BB4|nr:sigma 54-interacting transcriptional regulator [Crassaminicella profunda]QZY55225.1 sigma 54-interacting transcriptional regulator [Crassaminicella profunda]
MKKDKIVQELKKIIKNEDQKNPYTDIEIAKKLNISRSDVSMIRCNLKIKDSRERRKNLLINEIQKILKEEKAASVRRVTAILNEKGYKISRNLVFKFLKEIEPSIKDNSSHEMNKFNEIPTKVEDIPYAFDSLIGSKGSLKPQIELAKAAILYPKNGLHTLIYGPTGVGKSEMAECMYGFAIESNTKKQDAPFIVFNCADYADNPQLLLSQLFGYKKGAFTGATDDKAGLVEKANDGILFLDEIHRLPPEGQEIFFHLIDKGRFRRLGETENYRQVNILLIAATTENIESNLLATFKRRIPMIIELPALSHRPFIERYKIIKNFFKQEAIRMNANIVVSQNVVKALILYEPIGNIGQIRSDIQVTCARSFLKLMGKENKSMKIDITELPNSVVKGLLKLNSYRNEMNKIVKGDLEVIDSNKVIIQNLDDTPYLLSKEIYKEIESKYKVLKFQGIDEEIINRIIENELETKIYKSVNTIRKNKYKLVKNDLEKIVGSKIVHIVEKMIDIAKEYHKDLDNSLFYCLATHLAASYERLIQNKPINNPKLEKIKTQYPKEFSIAKEMSELASYSLKVNFPEDEIAFIAMYLKSCARKDLLLQKHVGVIVLSHGRVAEGMATVANRLLGVNHAKAVEMSLDESPSVALKNTKQIAKEIGNEKGILFLVDMGSLTGFGEIIGKELSIKTRTINRVDTMMVIEAVRKAMMPDSNLDEMADSLQSDDKRISPKEIINEDKKVIICVCLTGEGTAKALENVISERVKLDNKIEVMTMSVLENHNISAIVKKMSQEKKVIAIVGTINPQIPFIPFIDASEIIEGTGVEKLDNYINLSNNMFNKKINKKVNILANELIDEKTTILKSDIRSKKEAIEKMTNLLYELGYVKEKFKDSVYKREDMLPTLFKGGVALPHANPKYVNKPIIGILTLEKPILWDANNEVDCIFVVAINEYYKDEFRKLYKMINDPYFLNKIKESRSFDELREVIRNV